MRPRWPGRRSIWFRPKLVTPRARRSATNRSGASWSSSRGRRRPPSRGRIAEWEQPPSDASRPGRAVLFTPDAPAARSTRAPSLAPVEVAYETYGRLDARRARNAVFVCHALTGDAHAAGHHGDPDRPGWWDNLIGPGRPLDTDRFFVICANLLGGCKGTTGPSSTDPATGRPYGLRFPLLHGARPGAACTGRCVRPPRHRAARWRRSAGRSAACRRSSGRSTHPGELGAAAGDLRVSSRLSAQNIAFSAVAREAIMGDPDFNGGDYYGDGRAPRPRPRGGPDARPHHLPVRGVDAPASSAAGSRTPTTPRLRLRRRLPGGELPAAPGRVVPQALRRQQLPLPDARHGLLRRLRRPGGHVARPLARHDTRFLVLSFDSDWRFDTAHSREIVRTLPPAGAHVTFREIALAARARLVPAGDPRVPPHGRRLHRTALRPASWLAVRPDLASWRRMVPRRRRACSTWAAATATCWRS